MDKARKIHKGLWARIWMLALVAGILTACDDSLERLTTGNYPESGTTATTGKVLCIVIDGASGTAVNTAYTTSRAPNIRQMRSSAIYTFEGLADGRHKNLPQFTNQRGWANLMTGVTVHGVGLEKEPGGELKTIDELEIPSFLKLIKQSDKDLSVSLYAADQAFCRAFKTDADNAPELTGDEAVKEAVLAEIEMAMTSDMIVAQFSGVQKAGQAQGFYDAEGKPTEAVVNAVSDIDGIIGKIVKELESRENYRRENWLVMITSTFGGEYPQVVEASNYYDDPRLNTFGMLYNYQLVERVIGRPGNDQLKYYYYTPFYSGLDEKATAQVVDNSLFEMEADQSYTVQFMYYVGTKASHSLSILSKSEKHKGNKGWNVHGDGSRIKFRVGGRDVWSSQSVDDPKVNTDGSWHTVTLVFDRTDRRFRAYVDGNYSTHRDQQNMTLPTDLSCPDFPLTIGKIANSPISSSGFCVSNLQIYDVALPEEYIAANHGLTKLEVVQNEYWDHLIGYWPCDREEDTRQSTLKDYSRYATAREGKSDMKFQAYAWLEGGTVEPNIVSDPDEAYYQATINNVDIPFQAMQWLGASFIGYGFEGVAKTFDYNYMNEN